jgi:outer membrane protein
MIDMKKIKFGLIVNLLYGIVIISSPVYAQNTASPANLKFAVVNFQKIFREAAATRSIPPQVAKLKAKFESQFKDIQKKLQAAERDLQNQRAILSPDAYAEKQKLFKQNINGAQRDVQTVQRMVGRAEGDAYKIVRSEFHKITREIAKERSLDLIFPRSGLIHVHARYDISDAVLKRLNKRLPSVKVKLPPQRTGGAAKPPRKKK